MPSTRLTLDNLRQDFPGITFKKSSSFHWSPQEKTIYYANVTDAASLLHEVAHAALGHGEYSSDIELLKMERDAWQYVVSTLAKRYDVMLSSDYAENLLDTYRNWLHDRSLCPSCSATGIQTEALRYTCLACTTSWRVNEARTCALRRYMQSQNK